MRVFKTIMFLACVALSPIITAQSSPVPMLEGAANQIIATLKANQGNLKSNPDIIYKAVAAHLLPNVDVTGMSRSVLGRQAWNKASAAERAQFSHAFTQLVIRTYASPLAQYSNETIQFLPVRGDLNKRFVSVKSIIKRSQGPDIPLQYSLIVKNGQWKIYDISVEGVSLLQSFRSQFAQALQSSSINDLTKQMQNKTMNKAS